MEPIFLQYLKANPFFLLFLTVGLAVWVGKFSVKGYGLGMVVMAFAAAFGGGRAGIP
jgi:putative transport protein